MDDATDDPTDGTVRCTSTAATRATTPTRTTPTRHPRPTNSTVASGVPSSSPADEPRKTMPTAYPLSFRGHQARGQHGRTHAQHAVPDRRDTARHERRAVYR